MNKVAAIILAGGNGTRMGSKVKKQFIEIAGKEVIAHAIEVFNSMEEVDEIVVVTGEAEIEYVREEICNKYDFDKVIDVVAGGKERQDSVWSGICHISEDSKYVMIHDGARPFVEQGIIRKCLNKAKEKRASIVAVPVKDTIKKCNIETSVVEETPDRSTLWSVQTPQIFDTELIKRAHRDAKDKNFYGTDDSSLVEAIGEVVYITEGNYNNIKITTPEDLLIGEKILESRV